MKDFENRVAFITGGSSGIGLGIAKVFTDAGMKVVITYRTEGHLHEAQECLKNASDRVHAINVDVTDRSGMEKAAAETLRVFKKVHVLVNNAGVAVGGSLVDTTYEDWDFTINVNLNGVFNCLHTFLPRIQSHGEAGYIVTTSSVLGLFSARGVGAYSASKFAVVGLMEALRADLIGTDIGASVFCPGLVTSNIVDSNRNRPAGVPKTGRKSDAQAVAKDTEIRRDPELAMDPIEAGRVLLRGMQNNNLFIMTHPEYAAVLRLRHDAIAASIPKDLRVSDRRIALVAPLLRNSIYASGGDCKLD